MNTDNIGLDIILFAHLVFFDQCLVLVALNAGGGQVVVMHLGALVCGWINVMGPMAGDAGCGFPFQFISLLDAMDALFVGCQRIFVAGAAIDFREWIGMWKIFDSFMAIGAGQSLMNIAGMGSRQDEQPCLSRIFQIPLAGISMAQQAFIIFECFGPRWLKKDQAGKQGQHEKQIFRAADWHETTLLFNNQTSSLRERKFCFTISDGR